MRRQTYNEQIGTGEGRRPGQCPIAAPRVAAAGLGGHPIGYPTRMLYTILIILAIVALVLFILGRRSV
jgi:hypothetical protein